MGDKQQINLILLHIGIGALIAYHPPLSKIYSLLVFLVGLYIVVKNKNQNHEILYIIAYIAGSEVFFRATHGTGIQEFGKYSILFFSFLGFCYNGFPKIKNPYYIYLLLLLPSIVMSLIYLKGDLRTRISFEVLGPICVGILALYTYKRSISVSQIKIILNLIALPILTSCVYLILKYSHNVYKINWSESNFYFSGNYGPNQIATTLGLGVFIYLLKIITEADNKKIFYLNIIIFCLIFYRGLLTFSRGGITTCVIVMLTVFLSIYVSREGYYKLKRKVALSFFILSSICILAAYQTDNKLFKRYTKFEISSTENRIKKRGRYIQIKSDIENFIANPLLGVGVGKGKEIRKSNYNIDVATHSEITRLLSEHGVLGLFCLLILIFYPLQLYYNNLRNFYLLPFFIFWLFTINHSATRTIAPLLLYALSLLQIKVENEQNVET